MQKHTVQKKNSETGGTTKKVRESAMAVGRRLYKKKRSPARWLEGNLATKMEWGIRRSQGRIQKVQGNAAQRSECKGRK